MAGKTTAETLKAILRGAFAGSPTPLKDIPKKDGARRVATNEKPKKPKRGGRKK